MIEKKIHYIWLGGNELPKIAKKCIKSWKKFCPDYEIIRWDESNLNLDECKYARQAYDAKKYRPCCNIDGDQSDQDYYSQFIHFSVYQPITCE